MSNDPKKDLIARFHQLMANDRNAANIYEALAESIEDEAVSSQFSALAEEEAGHILLERELLEIVEKELSE